MTIKTHFEDIPKELEELQQVIEELNTEKIQKEAQNQLNKDYSIEEVAHIKPKITTKIEWDETLLLLKDLRSLTTEASNIYLNAAEKNIEDNLQDYGLTNQLAEINYQKIRKEIKKDNINRKEITGETANLKEQLEKFVKKFGHILD